MTVQPSGLGSPGDITVRQMNVADIPGMARAHVAAWQKAFRGILSDVLLDNLDVEAFEAVWREIIQRENRTNLVAERRGIILGYVAFGPAQNAAPSTLPSGEIIGLYVHPDHWRMGAGGHLLRHVLQALKQQGFARVLLWTMAENVISRGFYKKNGFVVDGCERTSQRHGEPFCEIRLTRPL